jgi:predicted nucleic acid-binding protein
VVSADDATAAAYGLIVDAGEAEAIAVARARAALLVIDDDRGRRLALRLGVDVKGTLGILVLAKRSGLLERVRPVVEALPQRGVYVSQRLIDAVLRELSE